MAILVEGQPNGADRLQLEQEPEMEENDDTSGMTLDDIRSAWIKIQHRGKGSRKSLEREVEDDLFDPIVSYLGDAIGTERHGEAVQDVTEFLRNDNASKIDDCVRWLILYHAVQATALGPDDSGVEVLRVAAEKEEIESECNVHISIARIVVSIAANLAFLHPTLSTDDSRVLFPRSDLSSRCRDKISHDSVTKKVKSTPFHEAAASGNGKAIKHMAHKGALKAGAERRDDFIRVLCRKDPGPTGKTALRLAALEANDGDLGALLALLDFDPGVARSWDSTNPETTFEEALEQGKYDVVDAFLGREGQGTDLVTSKVLVEAMDKLSSTSHDDPEYKNRERMVDSLIGHAKSPAVINEAIPRIVALNLTEIWDKLPRNVEFDTSGLLHLAVRHQNVYFVDKFLEEYQDLVIEKEDGNYPLWHNNKVQVGAGWMDRGNDTEARQKIRDLIVPAVIEKVQGMQKLSAIFQDCFETVHELCFDLSRFDSKSNRLSQFVRSLIHHHENTDLLSYERTLKYVELPALDLKADERETFGDSVRVEHTEVFDILKWLRDKPPKGKGVNQIIELMIPDRLVNPHNEVKIGQFVKDFKVEVLDWRFLDMSISIFDPDTKDNIKELHLYTSGKLAVLSHWLSKEGVQSLPNLTTLEIRVVQELMTKDYCRLTTEFARTKFKELSDSINDERRREGRALLRENVEAQLWNPTVTRLADLEEIAERAVPKLSRFIKSYHDHVDIKTKYEEYDFTPTKVAIIDNGILSISPKADIPWELSSRLRGDHLHGENSSLFEHVAQDGNAVPESNASTKYNTLWSRVRAGRSFVDDDSRVSPWLFASDPHGTQMANLICALDPLCELYVAKVSEGSSGVTPARVTRAVEWAISKEVDIISMSFAILDLHGPFRNVCQKAVANGIVLLCSTHDEGLNTTEAWPASFNDTITMTACDDLGVVLRRSNQKYDYAIQGKDVAVGKIPFLPSLDCVSGSSVATAIAAGLSSLTLSCDRLAHPTKKYDDRGRKIVIQHHLDHMRADATEKYIQLEKFAGIDEKLKDGRDIHAGQIVQDFFGGAQYRKN